MFGQWSWLVPLVVVWSIYIGLAKGEEDDGTRLTRLEEEQIQTKEELSRNQETLNRTLEKMLRMEDYLIEVKQHDEDRQGKTCPLTCTIETHQRDYRPIPYVIDGKTAEIHGDCQDAFDKGWNNSGIYTIRPDGSATFNIYCQFGEGQNDFTPAATLNVSKVFSNCSDAFDQGWRQSGLFTMANGTKTQNVHCDQELHMTCRNDAEKVAPVFTSCKDAYQHGYKQSEMYNIAISRTEILSLYCEQGIDGGGWEVFQQRMDGSVDFFRGWTDYMSGFGKKRPGGEYWLGLEAIYQMSKCHKRLKIELVYRSGEVEYADYSSFWLDDMSQSFRLHIAGYSGNATYGHIFAYNNGQQFTTKDHDRDTHGGTNCAAFHHGAWWYDRCTHVNLNGQYGASDHTGLHWSTQNNRISGSRMMLK